MRLAVVRCDQVQIISNSTTAKVDVSLPLDNDILVGVAKKSWQILF